jgi:pyrimidine operon attenuation protein/uracil phosphoribosyltransferase
MTKRASSTDRKLSHVSSCAFSEVSGIDAVAFRRAAAKIRKSIKTKDAARDALVDAGIYTRSGKLSSHYK